MYVETKIASVVFGVSMVALQNAVKRNSTKYTYRYIDGVGRGGKKLLIKVDEVELAALIDATVAEVGATSPKDMGKVISAIMAGHKGRVDGKALSESVKKRLQP